MILIDLERQNTYAINNNQKSIRNGRLMSVLLTYLFIWFINMLINVLIN